MLLMAYVVKFNIGKSSLEGDAGFWLAKTRGGCL